MSELESISENEPLQLEGVCKFGDKEDINQNLQDKLHLLVDQNPCNPLVAAKIIAPHNPELAKSFAVNHEIYEIKAYIEISKHLSEDEAQEILNELKKRHYYIVRDLKLIYEEETRRAMTGAERTYQLIKDMALLPYACSYDLIDFASIASHEENFSAILEKAHQKEMQDLIGGLPQYGHYGLLRLLDIEAKVSSSLAFETLKTLRSVAENTRKLYLNMYNSETFAEVVFLNIWGEILAVEDQNPFLSAQFEEDFSEILARVESIKTRFPDEDSELDYPLDSLFESLVVSQPKAAEKVLLLTDRDFCFIENMALLFEKNPSHLLLDREGLLAEMEKCLAQDTFPVYKAWRLVAAFRCIASIHCLDLALPYLERARTLAFEINDEDCERQEALCSILTAELDYNLPSFVHTLEELRETMKRASYVDADTYPVSLRAEVKCLFEGC